MKVCKNCLIPKNFPNSNLDENDVCSFCKAKRKSSADYSHELPVFEELIKAAKAKSQKYDCIVCYSGGKDSTYTLINIVERRLKPLAFTFDNGFISVRAKENIAKIIGYLSVDHIYFTPRNKQMKELFKTVMLKKLFPISPMMRLSSTCYVCITYVNWLALELALEKNCNMVVSGFTHGQVPKAVFSNNPVFLKDTFNSMKHVLKSEVTFDINSFYPVIDFDKLDKSTIYNVNPLLFEKYDEKKIIQKIKEFGWNRPKDTDSCSSNCLINRVGNYFHCNLYGYHPYQYEISQLIRNGSITIEEGRATLEDCDLDEISKEILVKIGIDNMEGIRK